MSTKAERIAQAREHYETRAERREAQVWLDTEETGNYLAPEKGAHGAIPLKIASDLRPPRMDA